MKMIGYKFIQLHFSTMLILFTPSLFINALSKIVLILLLVFKIIFGWMLPRKFQLIFLPFVCALSKKLPQPSHYLEYFTNLFEWIVTDNFNDETKFPSLSKDTTYPDQFRFCIGDISRRVFRVYAHLYHHHYSEFADNGIMPIENFEKSFELFYRFVKEYNLVSEPDLKPMEGLINIINM